MNMIKINDIEIYYNDIQNQNIDYIKNVINNNYNLFLSFLGKLRKISLVPINEDGVVYVSDFDKTFYEIVNQTFNNTSNNTLLENSDVLPALYIETLIRKNKNNSKTLVQPNSNISDVMVYSIIAYVYFKKTGTFDDFVNYLKDSKDKDKIFNWLQTEVRFDAYNYLLKTTVDFLIQYDFDFIKNISGIINMMLTKTVTNVLAENSKSEIELPKVTAQKIIELFNDFLVYINAPKEWKQLYDELRTSGKIIFQKQNDGFNSSMCYRDENNILKILVTLDGTINSFCSFVHEFMHYVSMNNDSSIQFSISEFPSIFFEKIAAQFLMDKGYEKDVITKVTISRDSNNIEIYMTISSLLNDISEFIENGPISRNKKILFLENKFNAIQDIKKKLVSMIEADGGKADISFLELPKVDVSEAVDKECDSLIDSFIQNGLLIINGYQYLLDTYLSEEVLKKINYDSSIISRMIGITNKLYDMNLKDILLEFDIHGIMNDTQKTGDVKTKNLGL